MLDVNLEPLTAARTRLEEILRAKMDEVTILKRKIEAFDVAINVIRSTDNDDLGDLPEKYRRKSPAPQNHLDADSQEIIKSELITLLQNSKWSMASILDRLGKSGYSVTRYNVRRLLDEIHARQEGERNTTVYYLDAGTTVVAVDLLAAFIHLFTWIPDTALIGAFADKMAEDGYTLVLHDYGNWTLEVADENSDGTS